MDPSTISRQWSALAVIPLMQRSESVLTAAVSMSRDSKMAKADDGFHDVELKLTGLGGKGDGEIVADDLEGDLVDDLRDHRVDLAGHDG